MKNSMPILAIVLMVAGANTAQATLRCQDVNAGPDAGYSVTVNEDGSAANIYQMTIAGTRKIAQLDCSEPEQQPSPNPDGLSTILACSEPKLRDAGYSLTVSAGGIAGITMATLYKVSLVGSKEVATFTCKETHKKSSL